MARLAAVLYWSFYLVSSYLLTIEVYRDLEPLFAYSGGREKALSSRHWHFGAIYVFCKDCCCILTS